MKEITSLVSLAFYLFVLGYVCLGKFGVITCATSPDAMMIISINDCGFLEFCMYWGRRKGERKQR
jgi:hypothetical protein